jgi:hypothetical protein
MNEGWWVLGACLLVVLSAALPLIRDRERDAPPPRKETLRDWRNGE